jgi:hypothetical protein
MELSGWGYHASAGETFDVVALMVYGDEKYAAELMCANPELMDRQYFTGGETVKLPVIDLPEDMDEEEYAGDEAPWRV